MELIIFAALILILGGGAYYLLTSSQPDGSESSDILESSSEDPSEEVKVDFTFSQYESEGQRNSEPHPMARLEDLDDKLTQYSRSWSEMIEDPADLAKHESSLRNLKEALPSINFQSIATLDEELPALQTHSSFHFKYLVSILVEDIMRDVFSLVKSPARIFLLESKIIKLAQMKEKFAELPRKYRGFEDKAYTKEALLKLMKEPDLVRDKALCTGKIHDYLELYFAIQGVLALDPVNQSRVDEIRELCRECTKIVNFAKANFQQQDIVKLKLLQASILEKLGMICGYYGKVYEAFKTSLDTMVGMPFFYVDEKMPQIIDCKHKIDGEIKPIVEAFSPPKCPGVIEYNNVFRSLYKCFNPEHKSNKLGVGVVEKFSTYMEARIADCRNLQNGAVINQCKEVFDGMYKRIQKNAMTYLP
jgi:hypothetical protein